MSIGEGQYPRGAGAVARAGAGVKVVMEIRARKGAATSGVLRAAHAAAALIAKSCQTATPEGRPFATRRSRAVVLEADPAFSRQECHVRRAQRGDAR